MYKKETALAVAVAGLFSLVPLSAVAEDHGDLQVSARVLSSCDITTMPVNFGNYDPKNKDATTTEGEVSVSCVTGTKGAHVDLSAGIHSEGDQREMQLGDDNSKKLAYELYRPEGDAAGAGCNYENVWGNKDNGKSLPVSDFTSDEALKYKVCGQIKPGLSVTQGDYTDTVEAKVWLGEK